MASALHEHHIAWQPLSRISVAQHSLVELGSVRTVQFRGQEKKNTVKRLENDAKRFPKRWTQANAAGGATHRGLKRQQHLGTFIIACGWEAGRTVFHWLVTAYSIDRLNRSLQIRKIIAPREWRRACASDFVDEALQANIHRLR